MGVLAIRLCPPPNVSWLIATTSSSPLLGCQLQWTLGRGLPPPHEAQPPGRLWISVLVVVLGGGGDLT